MDKNKTNGKENKKTLCDYIIFPNVEQRKQILSNSFNVYDLILNYKDIQDDLNTIRQTVSWGFSNLPYNKLKLIYGLKDMQDNIAYLIGYNLNMTFYSLMHYYNLYNDTKDECYRYWFYYHLRYFSIDLYSLFNKYENIVKKFLDKSLKGGGEKEFSSNNEEYKSEFNKIYYSEDWITIKNIRKNEVHNETELYMKETVEQIFDGGLCFSGTLPPNIEITKKQLIVSMQLLKELSSFISAKIVDNYKEEFKTQK